MYYLANFGDLEKPVWELNLCPYNRIVCLSLRVLLHWPFSPRWNPWRNEPGVVLPVTEWSEVYSLWLGGEVCVITPESWLMPGWQLCSMVSIHYTVCWQHSLSIILCLSHWWSNFIVDWSAARESWMYCDDSRPFSIIVCHGIGHI